MYQGESPSWPCVVARSVRSVVYASLRFSAHLVLNCGYPAVLGIPHPAVGMYKPSHLFNRDIIAVSNLFRNFDFTSWTL